MTKQAKHWKRISKKTVYRGRVHIIEHSALLPNGDKTTYEVDHGHGAAVAVLVKTDDECVFLTRQYRFPVDDVIYDLPGGGVGFDENLISGAIRECEEEIGIKPNKITKLAKFYPNPGRSDWATHLFFCDDYIDSSKTLDDPAEVVERIKIPVNELENLINNNEIVDPSLLIAWHTACSKGLIKV
jgi:ADP-ribose pyrophosphatase